MPIRLSFVTFAAVGAIVATSALLAGVAPPAAVAGSAGREVPYQTFPAQQVLANLKLAPAQTNSIFVPITPCRIMDTRVAGGKFADGQTRTYVVGGTTGFPAQGGNSGGCGIPLAATAIAANIQANSPSGNGYVRAWPASVATEPNATVMSYPNGIGITGASILSITPGIAASLKVRNHSGTAHLLIDATGYYEPQMHGMVSPASSGDSTHNAPIYAGSSRIVSATNPQNGVYVVTFDSNITYCTPIVDTYNAGSGIYGAAYAFSGSTATVFTWYLNTTTHQEVPFSFYFYIAIVC